ncbi:hypothetical protein [Brevibacillus laterosporus]|uniref:hypothetical protein n=1 Tax=Brevibacillus laterosporus TaxID=1465 RepID=UPI0009F68CC2|nr:hypothetical protein [Brevibacillus laterosporus]
MNELDFSLLHINQGTFVEAEYLDPLLDDYRDNPLIESLLPIWDERSVVQKLASRPLYKSSERELPVHLRIIVYSEFPGTSFNRCPNILSWSKACLG